MPRAKPANPRPLRSAFARVARASLLLVAILGLAACGGPSFAGSVYRDGTMAYRLGELGSGWERLDVGGHNDLAWRNAGVGAIVQVNASCPRTDAPLTALTNHLLVGFTQREIQEQALVPMDGREALRTHLIASLDGVPRELLFVVMKKDDCVYDFALIATPGGAYARALPSFERLVAGFSTEVPR